MIAKTTSEQLHKIKPDMQQVDEFTYVIHKQGELSTELIEGNFYIIKLKDSVLHPGDNSTIAQNWNNGVVPQSTYMKVLLNKISNSMLNFDAIGYNIETGEYINDVYRGLWLPKSGIQIIKKTSKD